MLRRLVLALTLFLGGCQGWTFVVDYEPQAGQAAAVEEIWNEVYGMAPARPPRIGWINENALNCNKNLHGNYDGFKLPDGDCVWGATWSEYGTMWIAHPVPEYNSFAFHDTLAHELWHYALYVSTGNPDHDHRDPGFGAEYYHPAGGAVDTADAALVASGL